MQQRLISSLLTRSVDALADDLEKAKAESNMVYLNSILEILNLLKLARDKIDFHIHKDKSNFQ